MEHTLHILSSEIVVVALRPILEYGLQFPNEINLIVMITNWQIGKKKIHVQRTRIKVPFFVI